MAKTKLAKSAVTMRGKAVVVIFNNFSRAVPPLLASEVELRKFRVVPGPHKGYRWEPIEK